MDKTAGRIKFGTIDVYYQDLDTNEFLKKSNAMKIKLRKQK